tara:strand:- start:366 stop:536 length:171 start_codon:yes stop_codon:yes gene_type:complete
MGYYKQMMIKLRDKKCTHGKSIEDTNAICSQCWIDLAKDKVCKFRNKTYIINNDTK